MAYNPATDDTDDDRWRVTVYRDHPAWDQYDRWFKLPAPLLAELLVAGYTVHGYGRPDEDHPGVKHIRAAHPGAVLVY